MPGLPLPFHTIWRVDWNASIGMNGCGAMIGVCCDQLVTPVKACNRVSDRRNPT